MEFSAVDAVLAAQSLGYTEGDLNMTTAIDLVGWFVRESTDPYALLAAPGVQARGVVLQYILEQNAQSVPATDSPKRRGRGKATGGSDSDSD